MLNGSREILQVGALVVATVSIEREDGEIRLLAQSMRPVDDVVANTEAGLRIFVEKPEACEGLRTRLEAVEQPKHKRGGEVSLVIMTASTRFKFSNGCGPSINFRFENGSRLNTFFENPLPNHHAGPCVLNQGCSVRGAKGRSVAKSRVVVITHSPKFFPT